MATHRKKFKDGVTKLFAIPVTSGRELTAPLRRDIKGKDAPVKGPRQSARKTASPQERDWSQQFVTQSAKIKENLSIFAGYSLLFDHGPAIISGIIVGLMLINWIGGLNDGAQFIVLALSILASEFVFRLLKKPHILAGIALSIALASWIEGLNLGAKLIVLFVSVFLSDAVYQISKKFISTSRGKSHRVEDL